MLRMFKSCNKRVQCLLTVMKKIVIRTKGKTFVIGTQDVLYCRAAGSYSTIFLISNEKIMTSVNLLNLYERMQCLPDIYRVGRSFLVNMNYVKCIHHGTNELELRDKIKIPYTISLREIEQQLTNTLDR